LGRPCPAIYTLESAGGGCRQLTLDGPSRENRRASAGFSPYDVATDRRGDIVIVDNSGNYQIPGNRIKMVPAHAGTMFCIAMRARHIYTVAGRGANACGLWEVMTGLAAEHPEIAAPAEHVPI